MSFGEILIFDLTRTHSKMENILHCVLPVSSWGPLKGAIVPTTQLVVVVVCQVLCVVCQVLCVVS